jgi:hypothetical protein
MTRAHAMSALPTEHKAHLPGRDSSHDNDEPVSSGNQITWPSQVQRPVRLRGDSGPTRMPPVT